MASRSLLSRRGFVKSAGVGSLGMLGAPLVGARGFEAARELVPPGPPAATQPFASDERAALRLSSAANAIRLDSNENPNGPGEAVLAAVREMFIEAPRYPDATTASAAETIASRLGIRMDQLQLGCGSGEILRMASYAFTSPERALVTGAPSFEDPVRHSQMVGAPIRSVPLDRELKLDLDAMLGQTRGAGLVFLCNPNNPTGTVHGGDAVEAFITEVHRRAPDCVVLVDEAYHEYVDAPSYRSAIPLALARPNVVVARTFSKVYGMAGLRAGYAIGQADTIARMSRYRLPNSFSVLAAAASIAAIQDPKHLASEQSLNRAARDYTRRELAAMGFASADSQTNFVMVDIGRDTRRFREACAQRGVLVGRPFPPLLNHSRISIGTMDEMRTAMSVFRQVLTGRAE